MYDMIHTGLSKTVLYQKIEPKRRISVSFEILGDSVGSVFFGTNRKNKQI